MRSGVRRIAAGQFSERLGSLGDSEFNELAKDFNRMSAQLDEVYRDLERKVAQKSRELVASERLASVGYLAAGVAHEINNPLNIISGFAELSLKKLGEEHPLAGIERSGKMNATPSGEDDTIRTLQIIRDEAFRCKEITSRLLSLSRPGGGRRIPVSVADVVRVVAEMVAGHHVSEGRRVEIDVNGDALLVFGDDAELKQVVLNLTVNALQSVKFDTGLVRIHALRTEQSIELHVTDNGRGMTCDTIERVFEPFYTLGMPGSSRGVGLGLSISRAIIEAHEGSIRAESDGLGHGSRFVVALPAITDAEISSVHAATGADACR
ncbi:MAG: HAMP domain-containing histidine kinase [Chthoniobacterales bacterium]|nr:HAMP domain-containing histidine kinase [Chthoniobacterales bacterium]